MSINFLSPYDVWFFIPMMDGVLKSTYIKYNKSILLIEFVNGILQETNLVSNNSTTIS